jgi:hypothetical protein
MTVNIAKLDIDTISEFQKKMHMPLPDGGELVSDFYQEFHRTSWYTHMPIKFDSLPGTDGKVVYPVNPTFDYLIYSYMRQNFPALEVKDKLKGKIQIAWCHNLATNNVEKAELFFDDQDAQKIDSVWFDIHSQFFMEPGYREHYNVSVGNVPFLEQWGSFLPAYTTNVAQPWYYCRDTSLAIPISACSLSKITHHYSFRDKVSKLLRMRGKTKEGWTTMRPKMEFVQGHGNDNLPVAELWGRYAYLSNDEREFHKCTSKRKTYIDDIIDVDAKDSATFGRTISLDLDCETPCRAFFWVAENEKAREQNNFSNYTTDYSNLHGGWSPVGPISLFYGGQSRLKNMAPDHFSIAECRNHFTSPPSEAGYNGYSFSRDPMSIDAAVGIVMKDLKVKFSATLLDGNPYNIPVKGRSDPHDNDTLSIDDDGYVKVGSELTDSDRSVKEGEADAPNGAPNPTLTRLASEQRFTLRVRLLVTRKMNIWTQPLKTKSGEDRKDKRRELFKATIM